MQDTQPKKEFSKMKTNVENERNYRDVVFELSQLIVKKFYLI